ncbi:MAG: nucleoside transporter C-terminal domain-containing protein [Thermoanaerobaculia bacterium]|nr:nucleoside transporter C-terminal domain-containing protein [Thermoanaerobaculia bacterium]
MNLISLLGMLVILGLAWAMSYHRDRLPLRTVVWGLGLQFVFAVIILREDAWSFVGMVVLAGLIATYLLRDDDDRVVLSLGLVGRLAAVTALGAAVFFLLPGVAGWLVVGLLVALLIDLRLGLLPSGARPLVGAAMLAVGVVWLIVNGLYGQVAFQALSSRVAGFLNLSDYGASFLFGSLADPSAGFGALFAFKVLPTIIFFGGFMAVLYYLGVMQKVIVALSRFVRWTIGTSGAETLSCTANIFVGQTEAPLLIKPFLRGMTPSELLTIMVGGFATIAGGVLAGYIAMGVPAGHLIAASVMSAPAALVIGKIVFPETEVSETAGEIEMPEIDSGHNVIEAATNGITDGLKLAVNVGAMLVGFIALMAVVDVLLNAADGWIDGRLLGGAYVEYGSGGLSPVTGEHTGWFPGSLRTFFGTVLSPLAFLMGVPWADAAQVGNLLGIKLSLNEFVSYGTLGTYIAEGALSERGTIVATYALCGFANFSSIGIQIGGIAAVAPSRKSDLARVGLRAMFGGALASWLTATIAGILLG